MSFLSFCYGLGSYLQLFKYHKVSGSLVRLKLESGIKMTKEHICRNAVSKKTNRYTRRIPKKSVLLQSQTELSIFVSSLGKSEAITIDHCS